MRAGAGLLAWGLIALACAGEGELDTSAEHWCEGMCIAVRRCGDVREQGPCRADCIAERPGLANISAEGAEPLGECISHLDCNVVFSEEAWPAAHEQCWQQAKPVVEVTQRVRSFCAEYSEALYECGWWLSTEECEGSFAMWADRILDSVSACMTRSTCELMDSCVEQFFEGL